MGPLGGIFFWVISQYFTLLIGVSGAMHNKFFYQSADSSDCLDLFCCSFQSVPSQVWMERQIVLPFYSLYDQHGWNLPGWLFYKVFLLHILVPRFPFFLTYRKFSCRGCYQSPTLEGRNVCPAHWGRRKGESCWACLRPSYFCCLTRGTFVGDFSDQWVSPWISWREQRGSST